jgi:hypothetical protein
MSTPYDSSARLKVSTWRGAAFALALAGCGV